jgi:hypothetical protein
MMPVIPDNKVVKRKIIIIKGRGEEEERHKGLPTQKNVGVVNTAVA